MRYQAFQLGPWLMLVLLYCVSKENVLDIHPPLPPFLPLLPSSPRPSPPTPVPPPPSRLENDTKYFPLIFKYLEDKGLQGELWGEGRMLVRNTTAATN